MTVIDLKSRKVKTEDDDSAVFTYKRTGNKVDLRIDDFGLDDVCFVERIIGELKDKIVSDSMGGDCA